MDWLSIRAKNVKNFVKMNGNESGDIGILLICMGLYSVYSIQWQLVNSETGGTEVVTYIERENNAFWN